PIKTETFETICGFCSVGCTLTFHHRGGYIMKVTGANGMVNTDGNLCMYGKFGYRKFNSTSRLTKPLKKVNDKFVEISFDEAYRMISDQIKKVKPEQNAFFAGASLTNEEQYLVQKFARAAAKNNNIGSFHYMNGDSAFAIDSLANFNFDSIKNTNHVYLLASQINRNNPVLGYMLNAAKKPITVISTKESNLADRANEFIQIQSYYHFVKAVNHYLLTHDKQNMIFIGDHCDNFGKYDSELLLANFADLCKTAGTSQTEVERFANEFNNDFGALLVFAENEVSNATAQEIFNLMLITGKLGKTNGGLIALKQKNNSHGLIDMGVRPETSIGMQSITNPELVSKLRTKWKVDEIPANTLNVEQAFSNGDFKNIIIFGEDPVGTATHKHNVKENLKKAEFIVVQDSFMSETAEMANLVLPASFWFETGGSFTNSNHMVQTFSEGLKPKVEHTTVDQLLALLKQFNINGCKDVYDVQTEILSLLPQTDGHPDSLSLGVG
ncbi:MAG TPA: molybdopterin-dependent oxidoreductase, partial [Tenuifilaceae bacterium]|nr:molybdopterin-dependent oxidoreductase [Tenuifilaceae bacterium]